VSQVNPYASPQSPFAAGQPPPLPIGPASPSGLWRQGKLLVMHKSASLPDRCVKSNQPAHGRTLKRKLSWHHPLLVLILLISPIIYIIVALIVMKRATVHIGLSEEWFARRRRTTVIATCLVLASVLLFIAGVSLADSDPNFTFMIVAGIALFFGGLIYGLVAARMVTPARITETHVWLKGVHSDFLAGLPELPPSAV
jgi:hypothetical protein